MSRPLREVGMRLADLLTGPFEGETEDVWENERTATSVRCFGVRLHSRGLSLREVEGVLEWLDVDRSFQAVWYWNESHAQAESDPPTATPSRVAVDETAIKVNGEWRWLYVAIDIQTKLVLDVAVLGRRGTDPAAAFLHRLTEKHDLAEAVFLVDGYGYLTALSRLDLSGRLDYTNRDHIKKWFHTLKMRNDRFHASWVDSRAAVCRWLRTFRYYYNRHRPHQSLNGRAPIEATQTVQPHQKEQLYDCNGKGHVNRVVPGTPLPTLKGQLARKDSNKMTPATGRSNEGAKPSSQTDRQL